MIPNNKRILNSINQLVKHYKRLLSMDFLPIIKKALETNSLLSTANFQCLREKK